ncbi:dTDP-4-dehydrorhamnose 3,5-epimerase [Frigidibacter sp. MR17.24]|uniref:dTDP-4-dehydrorhamnose 3,5-epimerase n=1 Tax=Frigidibacter sp. MR17.24 TaxID=3127345 RepID=UPI003012D946
MIFHPTTLADCWLIDLEPRGDERGFFARTMCRDEFAAHGIVTDYAQQNLSLSRETGTLRGMHFQRGEHVEAKLVRAIRGTILDVIVDLREGSPSHMRHEAFELSGDNRRALYVPPGFAHGFQTLTPDCEVLYSVSAPYAPGAEGGLRHDDPALGISWPLPVAVISPKDAAWPLLAERAEALPF